MFWLSIMSKQQIRYPRLLPFFQKDQSYNSQIPDLHELKSKYPDAN